MALHWVQLLWTLQYEVTDRWNLVPHTEGIRYLEQGKMAKLSMCLTNEGVWGAAKNIWMYEYEEVTGVCRKLHSEEFRK